MKEVARHENETVGECFRELRAADRLRVLQHDRSGFQKTFALIIARFGSGDLILPDGTPLPDGIAHFFEHCMFGKLDGDISHRFSAHGMSANAATGVSRTAYHFAGSTEFARGAELLLELVLEPHFPTEKFESERRIILREMAETHARPARRLYDNLHRALYHAHPVRRDILGTAESLAEITPSLLYRCHETFYAPENLSLYFYGGDETEAALERIESTIGSLATPPGAPLPFPHTDEPDSICERRIVDRDRVSRPYVAVGFKFAVAPGELPSRPLLRRMLCEQLCTDLLFGAGSEWFERAYAEGIVDDSFEAGTVRDLDHGYASLAGMTDDPQAFVDAIHERIEQVRVTGVDEPALRRLTRRYVGSLLRGMNLPEDAVALFAHHDLLGVNILDSVEVALEIEPPEIAACLQRVYEPARCAVSILEPR